MKSVSRLRDLLYITPVLLVAFGLRAYRLGWQSLWYDEGNSALMAGRNLPQIIAGAAGDIHPPLYYILLSWWSNLAGTGEFSLRFLSLAFGLLLVAVVYKLGQKLFAPQAGLAAAAIAAVSPFLVYYSQEARMYMLGSFLCALSGLFFLKALAKDRYWAAYALTAVAALYTQYFTFGVILALNVFFAFAVMWRSGRGLWARWLAANVAVAFFYLPWLPALVNQAAMWPKASQSLDMITVSGPGTRLLWDWPIWALLGPWQPEDNSMLFVMSLSITPALTLLALSALGWPGLAQALRGQPRGSLGRSLGLLFTLTATLISGLTLLVPLWRPAFNPKFLIFGLPWLYLWLGLGIVSLACAGRYFFHVLTWPFRRKQRTVHRIPWLIPLMLPTAFPLLGVGLAVFIALPAYYTDPRYARDDYRGLVRHIETQAQPGDAIILDAPGQTEIFGYYYKGQTPIYPLPRQRPLEEASTGQDLAAIASDYGRLWVVLWGQRESDPTFFIERWLDQRAYKAADQWFGGVRLALYSLPPPGEQRRMPLEARFGEYARLVGASFSTPALAAGRPLARATAGGIIPIALYWEAIAPTSQRYKVFVHLLGPDATLWGQHDSEPAGGSSSTTDWRPGEAVADNHGLPIALGTPPGESGQYEIEVGMYDPATGQRLPVFDSNGNPIGDRVVLGTVQVVKPAAFPSRESLAIEHPLDVHYRELLLMGYEFFKLGTATGNVDFRTGDLAHLALFWRAEAKPADYFPPSAVILDSANQEVARYNGTAAGKYGTSRWDPGEVVRDQYKLALSIPPGSYRLALIVTHAGGPLPVNPTGQGLKLIDGKLILAEFQVK